jgi:unsaturated chondroitin disaccharide hydrolase
MKLQMQYWTVSSKPLNALFEPSMQIDETIELQDAAGAARQAADFGSKKIRMLLKRWNTNDAPVFTVAGRYRSRNWTSWTRGFLYGQALLCFELTGEDDLLNTARELIRLNMPGHATHFGVHDHGFNCVSTYGNLRRLILQKTLPCNEWELNYYELALKVSGAVQAARWTGLPDGFGFIHSFNGEHSLFIDTLRSLRILALSYLLGHELLGEQDCRISLLERLLIHARTTTTFNIYYGEGRDAYDTPRQRGRIAHEAIFNPASGQFRCPSTQQGYSPFTTWTRGLAWAMLGTTEQIEFLRSIADRAEANSGVGSTIELLLKAAEASCDFYITNATARDGICYWDTGAPGLACLGNWREQNAQPANPHEPVDSSASAIAAQGLLRLGHILGPSGKRYSDAGLTVARTLFRPTYLSDRVDHEGLLLHAIYHRPNGWDYVPIPGLVPHGESCMWGDYHLVELALLICRLADGGYYTFFQ